jgi:hypothetical protein
MDQDVPCLILSGDVPTIRMPPAPMRGPTSERMASGGSLPYCMWEASQGCVRP